MLSNNSVTDRFPLLRYWLSAASYETHEPVSEAETALAFFYSRKSSMFHNIDKAYYWHNRAARHGSLESLGKNRSAWNKLAEIESLTFQVLLVR